MVQDKFFVRINNAETMRKNLLGLSKDLILAMKRFHNLKQIRQEKKKCTQHVSKIFKDIENLCQSMDFSAPVFGIGVDKGTDKKKEYNNEQHETQEHKEQTQKETIKEEPAKKPLDTEKNSDEYDEQMKRIEKSAAEIERKLRELV
ncbi:MAG: hypothetical protein ACOCQG_03525 [Candidatus Nanoarchaeia archaeon]